MMIETMIMPLSPHRHTAYRAGTKVEAALPAGGRALPCSMVVASYLFSRDRRFGT
jgi:hypothetical protein